MDDQALSPHNTDEPPSKRPRGSPLLDRTDNRPLRAPALTLNDKPHEEPGNTTWPSPNMRHEDWGRYDAPMPRLPELSQRRSSAVDRAPHNPLGIPNTRPGFGKPPELPSIVQRRENRVQHPRKWLNIHSALANDDSQDDDFSRERLLLPQSAPPNQLRFDRKGNGSPESYRPELKPINVRRDEFLHDAGHNAHTPGSSRLYVPQTATIPSPSYHASRIGTSAVPTDPDGHDISHPEDIPRSPLHNKAQFLGLFSDFFESILDSRKLKATLEYQIRSSNALLQTLQRSSQVFDEIVDHRIRQERALWESRVAQLENRLEEMNQQLYKTHDRAP